MLIHFIGSRSTLDRDIKYYRRILDLVQKSGHSLTSDWVEHAYELSKAEGFEKLNWNEIYSADMEALAKTDVVIADVTSKSFAVGFHVAVALQQKKPTLLLRREIDAQGEKPSYYPTAAHDSLLMHRTYNDKNLEDVITSFVEENRIDNKDLRFNFFIDRQIYNYLRWAAFKTGKTKAEILRELVKRELDKQDLEP